MAGKKNTSIDDDDDGFDELVNSSGGPGRRDDDDEGAEPDIQPGDEIDIDQPSSRRERRRNRMYDRAAQEAEARIAPQLNELRSSFQRMEQLLSQRSDAPAQGGQPPPGQVQVSTSDIDSALQGVYDQQDALAATARAKLEKGQIPQAEYDEMNKKARALEERRIGLLTLKTNRVMGVGAAQQQDPEAVRRQVIAEQIKSSNSDVFAHQRAPDIQKWAGAYFDQQAALGRTPGMDLTNEAFDAARKAFGLPTKSGGARHERRDPPTQNERARYSGTSGGAGGGGSPGTRGGGKSVKVTGADLRMARALFSHMPDKDDDFKVRELLKLRSKKSG